MSYYLIGIGGTGARCMEAFVHLNGAGLLQSDNDVKLIFVDPDGSCGNLSRATEGANLYADAYEMKLDAGNVILQNKIILNDVWKPIPEKNKEENGSGSNIKANNMDEIFQYDNLKINNKPLAMLYSAIFTEQERRTNLDMGFRGHPVIGAATVGYKMDMDKEAMWKDLLSQLIIDKDPRIFLFASVFGGTGASGFPNIARIIKESFPVNKEGPSKLKVGGCLLLPYFSFPEPKTEEEMGEMQARSKDFIFNTRSALEYYNDNNLVGDVYDAIYMLGDHEMTLQKEFSLGSLKQKNDAHFIEMFAALAAFDFFNKDVQSFKEPLTPMIAIENDKLSWTDFPNVCENADIKRRISTYIKFLHVYRTFVMEELEKIHLDDRKKPGWYIDLVEKAGNIDVYRDSVAWERFKALHKYADLYFEWLQQICSNGRCAGLINPQVFTENYKELDAYEVVLPITERKDKLTRKELFQQLSKYKVGEHTNHGAGILLQALYEICDQ